MSGGELVYFEMDPVSILLIIFQNIFLNVH